MVFNLFEEGVYSYYVFGTKPNFCRKLVSKMVFGMYYLDNCKNVYVYNPELVDDKFYDVNKIAIPVIRKTDGELINYLNNIMCVNLDEVKLFDKKYIFLDSAFQLQEESEYQKRLISLVRGIVEKKDLYIKLHPRTERDAYGDDSFVIKTNSSLELLAMNKKNTNNVIISITSSASLNFKLIFEEEPYVIMLYKLFNVKVKRPYIYNFIEKVKNIYSSNKFFVPENEDELIDIINKIKNNNS